MLAQAIVGEFCRSGAIGDSIDDVKRALRERRDAVADGLAEHIGDEAKFVRPEGGYFLWVELGEDVDTTVLLAAAAERGVTFVAGTDFMLEGGTNALRLAYSAVTPEQATRARGASARRSQSDQAAGLGLAAVAVFAEHQLLGQRGARRR